MNEVETLMRRSGVHDDWRPLLTEALSALEHDYLRSLIEDDRWLPGIHNLLAAFRRNREGVRYLLIGESPYPRRESANGIAFYDAAVDSLWSEKGLSTAVNRATSLRNIMKTALLAGGYLQRDVNGKISQQAIAKVYGSHLVDTLDEVFNNLQREGFLMLNATPVLHPERKPMLEARYWDGFLERLLEGIAMQSKTRITLLLWGKIAQQIASIPASESYRNLVCEHPYNLSFIDNPCMQELFAVIDPLRKRAPVPET